MQFTFKLLSALFLIFATVSARLSPRRGMEYYETDSRDQQEELRVEGDKSKVSKQPKQFFQTKRPGKKGANGGKNEYGKKTKTPKLPKGAKPPTNKPTKKPTSKPTSMPSISLFCSVLPPLSAFAPTGAKLSLYGICDQKDVIPIPDTTIGYIGMIAYGKCDIYTKTTYSADSLIGVMRYDLDAAFDGTTFQQSHSTTRLFLGASHQVILISAAIVLSTTGAILTSPMTYIISKVGIDQGLDNQYVDDCNFSSYNRMVIDYSDYNNYKVNMTFF